MTDPQKLLAIGALGAGELRVFVTISDNKIGLSPQGVEIKQDGVLASVCGYGEDFEEALGDLWRQLTELGRLSWYLVVNAGREDRAAVRWNGAAWKRVPE